MPDDADVTHDTLLLGKISLLQPRRGYRTSLDPVLLARFVTPGFTRFLDVGCGTGAISLLLLALHPHAHGVGVEVQSRLAALAARSTQVNGFAQRFELRTEDVRAACLDAVFDLVVTNPPFQPHGRGNLPPDRERSIAHHEVLLTLPDWLAVGARVLRPGGRLAAIFPAERAAELDDAARLFGLTPSRIRPVISRAGEAPRRVLFEATKGEAPALISEPPLVVHEGAGFTAQVRSMLGEPDDRAAVG